MTTKACNLIKVILEHDRILQELRTRIKGEAKKQGGNISTLVCKSPVAYL